MPSLSSQPNDHLTVIASFLDGLDLKRCMRVSKRLAVFARKQWPATSTILDRALEEASRYSHQLSDVFPHVRVGITRVTRQDLISTCTNLVARNGGPHLRDVTFTIDNVNDVRNATGLFQLCPDIETLVLVNSHLDDTTRFGLISLLRRLKKLNLTRNRQLGPSSAAAIALQSDLRSLILTECSVSDHSVALIVQVCESLEELHLERCYAIGIETLTQLSHAKNLRVLDLAHCQGVYDSHIKALARGCQALQTLVVSYCMRLVDLRCLASLPHLKALDVSNTSVSIASIQAVGPMLNHLNINGCIALTGMECLKGANLETLEAMFLELSDSDLMVLGEMPKLKLLDVRRTGVSKQGFDALHEAFPHIELITTFNTSLYEWKPKAARA